MRLSYHAISHTGLRRDHNEDMALVAGSTLRDGNDSFAFGIPEDGIKFCAIVCDGLGGREGGEMASELACTLFGQWVNSLPAGLDDNDIIQSLKQWVRDANNEIMRRGNGNGMATTLSGLLLYFDRAYVLNIGDSRTYRLRYDMFKQLSADHSERDRTGDLSIPSSVIYNCLGIPECFIDITPTRIVEGDTFVICSDGLSDMVGDETIAARAGDAPALVEAALEAGGLDNVTVISLEFKV